MRNVDKLARFITKNGAKNLLIHTIAGTKYWLLCQKIGTDSWLLVLCNPMGYSAYNIGTVDTRQHLDLWLQLVQREVDLKIDAITRVKELRQFIRNFLKFYGKSTTILK